MAIFTDGLRKRFFPCPICGDALDVRLTKKSKPYVVCHGCGVQLFVRAQPGIEKFDKLVADAEARNIWERLAEVERRYLKQCPACGKKFWVTEELIATNWFSGCFEGYQCPEEGCEGIVKPEEEQ